jgi:hypothetical protein
VGRGGRGAGSWGEGLPACRGKAGGDGDQPEVEHRGMGVASMHGGPSLCAVSSAVAVWEHMVYSEKLSQFTRHHGICRLYSNLLVLGISYA